MYDKIQEPFYHANLVWTLDFQFKRRKNIIRTKLCRIYYLHLWCILMYPGYMLYPTLRGINVIKSQYTIQELTLSCKLQTLNLKSRSVVSNEATQDDSILLLLFYYVYRVYCAPFDGPIHGLFRETGVVFIIHVSPAHMKISFSKFVAVLARNCGTKSMVSRATRNVSKNKTPRLLRHRGTEKQRKFLAADGRISRGISFDLSRTVTDRVSWRIQFLLEYFKCSSFVSEDQHAIKTLNIYARWTYLSLVHPLTHSLTRTYLWTSNLLQTTHLSNHSWRLLNDFLPELLYSHLLQHRMHRVFHSV